MPPDFGEFTPWKNRHSGPKQRIHEELTESARRRIGYAVGAVTAAEDIQESVKGFQIETGQPLSHFDVKNPDRLRQAQFEFITEEGNDEVLTYLEILLNVLWGPIESTSSGPSKDELIDLDIKLRRILTEEGILLQIKPERSEVLSMSGDMIREMITSVHTDGFIGEPIRFEKLSDASVIDADQAIQSMANESRWEAPLEGYHEAWEMYQDGQFSYIIAEKLYNSLEAVLMEICVTEGWNTPEDTVSSYLDSMGEHDLFQPNNAMIGEWNQILKGIQIGIQRTGSDRKRHEKFDPDYAILLLHHVAAFLMFIINRYERYDSTAK